MKDTGFSVGFIRWDDQKWLEITYGGKDANRTLFFDVNDSYKLKGKGAIELDYDVLTATYYELDGAEPRRCLP